MPTKAANKLLSKGGDDSERGIESQRLVSWPEEDGESRINLNRLVRCLAGQLLARIPRDMGIEMSDLVQAGNLGLIQAARTFRAGTGTPLAGYAKLRIRGEMLDTVRRHSGRGAGANRMSCGRDLTDRLPAPPEKSPLHLLALTQRVAILSQAISRLPERQRTVVRLLYSEGRSLREIGQHLRVNESRACQIHHAALGRLRRALSRRGVTGLSQIV